VLDLDYPEDSGAKADANFVLTASGGIVEVQATAEERAIGHGEFETLMALARQGVVALVRVQRQALGLE
jgi:ribonuclease PH